MAVLLFCLLFLILIITSKRPIFYQWLLILILIDPSGHITRYFSKTYSWGIEPSDVIYILIILSFFILGNRKLGDFFSNKISSQIFWILFSFFLYRIFVYGYLVPPVSGINEYLRYFIVRERTPLISFFILIPAYLIALKDLQTFYRLFVILGSLSVILFVFSVISGIEIVPFSTMERYKTGNVLRQFMYSYSAPTVLIAFAVIIYISKVEIRYKKLLYTGAIFSVIAILISLTKGLYINLVAIVFFSAFFTSRALRVPISKGTQQVITIGLIAILIIGLVLPSYLGYSKRLINEIYTFGTTGAYEGGRKEGRKVTVLPAQLYMIKERPLLGTGMYGYKENNLSKEYDITAYDTTDVPITGTIMQYGILGMIIYYFYYFKYYKVLRNLYLFFKIKNRFVLLTDYKYELILSITIISLTVGGLVNLYGLTGELASGSFVPYIFVGIILASVTRILRSEATPENRDRLTTDFLTK